MAGELNPPVLGHEPTPPVRLEHAEVIHAPPLMRVDRRVRPLR
jgi:hypothetical protein